MTNRWLGALSLAAFEIFVLRAALWTLLWLVWPCDAVEAEQMCSAAAPLPLLISDRDWGSLGMTVTALVMVLTLNGTFGDDLSWLLRPRRRDLVFFLNFFACLSLAFQADTKRVWAAATTEATMEATMECDELRRVEAMYGLLLVCAWGRVVWDEIYAWGAAAVYERLRAAIHASTFRAPLVLV